MEVKLLTDRDREEYDKLVTHVVQSWEWGNFRKKIGTPLGRYGIFDEGKMISAFMVTFHKIPYTPFTVGYLPKGPFPDKNLADALLVVGKNNGCSYIKTEPHITIEFAKEHSLTIDPRFDRTTNEYFTPDNFVIDLTQPIDQIIKKFNPSTRRNINLAKKNGVHVEERTDDEAFKEYLKLYFDTTKRQGYKGHTPNYHQKAWETMRDANMARILIGTYQEQTLTAWMIYNFGDTLFYPYGGSSLSHPEARSNNLVAFKAIELGKKLGLKKFDMWGALASDASEDHPYYGFHRFKRGYGGELLKYIGTYDILIPPSFPNNLIHIGHSFIDEHPNLKFPLLKMFGK